MDLSYPVAAVHCSLKDANPPTALEGKHILEALFDKNLECFFHRVDSDGKYEVELIDFSPQPNTSVVVASGMNVAKQEAVSPVLMKGQAGSPALIDLEPEESDLRRPSYMVKEQAVFPALIDLEPEDTDLSGAVIISFRFLLGRMSTVRQLWWGRATEFFDATPSHPSFFNFFFPGAVYKISLQKTLVILSFLSRRCSL